MGVPYIEKNNRRCIWCGRPIPKRFKQGAKYCKTKCSNAFRAYKHYEPKKKYIIAKRNSVESERIAATVHYEPNQWQKIVRASDARFKVIAAGRRAGKSYYVAHDPKDGAAGDIVDGTRNVWIVAPTYDLTGRIWQAVWLMAQRHLKPYINRITNTPGNFKIICNGGGFIEAKSAETPENLVGVGLHKLIVDEAPMVSKKAWTMALRPTLLDYKGTGIFIGSPKAKNWFYDIWRLGQTPEGKERGWESWQFTSFDNDKLQNREDLDEIIQDQSQIEYQQEILGQFIEGEGALFHRIREHATGTYREPVEAESYYMGVDLGGKVDPTVISVINAKDGNLDYLEVLEDTDWGIAKERIRKVFDRYFAPITTVDASALGGDNACQELRDEGISVEPFNITGVSKPRLIGKLVRFWEQNYLRFPYDDRILKEFEVFSFRTTIAGNRQYSAPSGKHDDIVLSIALAIWPMDAPGESTEIEFFSTKQNEYT